MSDWDFTTLAYVWDHRKGSIAAGAEKLDALEGQDRQRSLEELTARTASMVGALDDGWLLGTASYMVDDIYRSFFRFTFFSQGVLDYLHATAGEVVRELSKRGFVLHYVVDATQGEANLENMLECLPDMFQASGLWVVGPQLAARTLVRIDQGDEEGDAPVSMAAMQACRDEGHMIADEVIAEWHAERKSSAYLNIDLDDDTPALSMDTALAVAGQPRTVVVFRDLAPNEGVPAKVAPPPDVAMPAGMPAR